ncbi:MAG: YeaH/YhbH family protein [Betaproteobacteria bacterium]|jgi:hypothetical protein|nr:YeaH/YhbH family protein [Betaproteobacteria bacterium]
MAGSVHLIDRRLNGGNKSATNRQRFIRRYKEQLKRAVGDMVDKRSITDIDGGGEVNLPARDISEPSFRHGAGGNRETVHPGNREFSPGDTIQRPQGGGGGGGGSEAGEGESTDSFVFTLSREEFLNIFFDDLELPHLVRNYLGAVQQKKMVRAGYVVEGSPTNLSVPRTMKSSLGRRVALSAPIRRELEVALAALAEARARPVPADADEVARLEARVAEIEARLKRVPFLDDLDLRYRHRVSVPQPVARAVMFCLMDVSASMDERKKDVAKRFFTLLYLFLSRKYEKVEIVFVRHTDNAEEVDENTFFHDPKSGGTVVLSALELMHEIQAERFPVGQWNIYAAQASDGDAFGSDAGKSARFLGEKIVPVCRYFAYVEIPDGQDARQSSLWVEYDTLTATARNFAMRRVCERDEIYPVFHELFKKETA